MNGYQPSADRYDKMQYKYCGNSGLLLPRISLGLWHNFGSVDDFGVATDMIKYAFDNGVTHFDLANNYGPVPGSAEINFGKILKENCKRLLKNPIKSVILYKVSCKIRPYQPGK